MLPPSPGKQQSRASGPVRTSTETGFPQRGSSSPLCRLVFLRGKWEQELPPPPTLALAQCTSVAPGAACGRPRAHLLLWCSAELPASGAMASPRGLGKMGPAHSLSVEGLSQLLGRPGSRTLVALSIHDLLPKDRGQDLTPLSLWPHRGGSQLSSEDTVAPGRSRGPLLPPSLRTGTSISETQCCPPLPLPSVRACPPGLRLQDRRGQACAFSVCSAG